MKEGFGKGKTQVVRPYTVPVGNLTQKELPQAMDAAMDELKHRFPKLGITLFVFDYGSEGGLAYASSGDRAGNIKMILNWIENQLSGASDPV